VVDCKLYQHDEMEKKVNIKKALFVIVILILLFLTAPAVHVGSTDAGGLPMSTTAAPTTVLQPEPTTTIDPSFLNTTTSTTRYTPPTVPQYRNTETETPSSDRWDSLAVCESSENWSYPPVAGGFSGGIMFYIGTWRSMGGEEFAPDAYLASREQQIIVAERVLATSGWNAWPGCSRKFGWI